MTFTAPLGLLALFAVPAVVILHLYRRRLKERRVAAVFLFEGERLVTDAGRTRTRLLRTPSFWLECLIALLLALWLAGPSFGGAAARHVVFVLDDSASMQAGGRAAAIETLADRLGALGSHDRVTVLRTGPRPEVLVGPRALPSEIPSALRAWLPARPRHDPIPALDLARELAAGLGEVVYCTDEPAPFGSAGVEVVAGGKARPNAAILTAQRFRREEAEELRVRVAGFGGIFRTDVAVFAGDAELLRRPVDLSEGHGDFTAKLPAGTGPVRLVLGEDALPIDNEAWLLPDPARIVRVCDLLEDGVRDRLALGRVFDALRGHVLESDPLTAQLLVTTRPGRPLAGQTEVVISAGEGERDGWRGPFVVDQGNAWLAGIHLHGVVWLAGREDPPGRALVAASNRALVTEEFVETGRRLWINLDPGAGNLMRSPDWPLLFANLLDQCRDEVPGPVQVNVVIGDEARYRRTLLAGSEDSELWLEFPDGPRIEGRGDRVVGWIVDRPGLHRVLGRSGAELGAFAVRFLDPSESDLRGLVTERTEPGATDGGDGSLRDTTIERRMIGLLLLLLALADWWVLAGRRA